MKIQQVDIAIIGLGSAGMNAYRVAKQQNKKVISIENHQYGTTCARVGCMPSKLLIAAAEVMHTIKSSKPFGITINGYQLDPKAVMQRVQSERDRFVSFVLKDVEEFDAQDKIEGKARFIDDKTIQVDENLQIQANSFVIATGSVPKIPNFLTEAELGDRLITNEQIFELEKLPESVAVFGQGVIGLELGQALHYLGVDLTLFASGSGRLAFLSDPQISLRGYEIFKEEFNFESNPEILEIKKTENGVLIRYLDENREEQNKEFEYVLCASGRKANIDELGLENTSVELDSSGFPIFDRKTLKCSNAPIFLAGDATSELGLLHEAVDEGRLAGLNACNYPNISDIKRRVALCIAFTDPNIAVVGSRFVDLEEDKFVVGKVDFSGQGRSRVMLKNRGLLHVYVDLEGKFLGAEMIAPRGEHLAHTLSWVVGENINNILEKPFYHPVIEEGVRTAFRDALSKLEKN